MSTGHLLQHREVPETTGKVKVKPDIILKNFWRDNARFADLFNAALFGGRQVLNPDDLVECDTDVSSIVRFNNHVQTVQKIYDVVKKTAYGTEFVLWGLEDQNKIHYAMPLRHMLGDSFSYLKEYNEIAARNKQEKGFQSPDEFLSRFRKTDRLHPVISLCVYYGEDEWDGPLCLKDMLEIPESLEPLVADYKMNLVQLRKSGKLQFHNSDVETVFNISRFIYEHGFEKIRSSYKDKSIPAELGLVIGSITGYRKIIDQALEAERKGGEIYMCKALEEWEEKIRQEERQKERQESIRFNIRTCKKFNIDKDAARTNIMEEFSLSEQKATEYVKQYW